MYNRTKRVHFVGIGGIGMSGLAEILLNLGYQVSGSDLQLSELTHRLERLGAKVYQGHSPSHIGEADIVVYSTAVPLDNVELQRARDLGKVVLNRSQLLADLMRLKPHTVAVGGTHGKTTTTSMIASVLEKADIHSTAIIGGILKRNGSNVCWGQGDYLVAETDEHDGSFLKLSPAISVVTNIDPEHMEYYGTLDALKAAFLDFINKIPFYGFSVVCADDVNLQDLMPRITVPFITYGLQQKADLMARSIEFFVPSTCEEESPWTTFEVLSQKGAPLDKEGLMGRALIKTVGHHNVQNALAAIGVGLGIGMDFTSIAEGLSHFHGVMRRLEIKGKVKGITVMEDYAHHPTEIKATVEALSHFKPARLMGLFQPHLYSRTKFFCQEFAQALMPFNRLIVTEIYGARETPMEGVSGLNIVKAMASMGHKGAEFIIDREEIMSTLAQELRPGDLIAVLGAGDIGKLAFKLVERLKDEG